MDRTTLSRIHRLEMMFSELGNTLFPIVVSSSAPNFPTEKAVWIDADDLTISFQYKVGNTSIWVAFGDFTIHKLIDLADVDITDIGDNKLLVYDSISELHKYKDYLTALADLLDVDNSNKGDGKVPVYRTATSKHEYESIDDKANSGDLATIATTGSYNDLDDVPTEFPPEAHSHNLNDLTEKSYNSLTDKPTIPDAQIQSDWDQADSGEVDYIKNKPVIPSQYTDEMAQDAIGGILTDSDEIDFEYDDYTPEISATIKPGSIDESKLNVSVNASLDKADGSLQIDQTVPQTISNGIPLLESTRVINEEHELVDKLYVDLALTNIGINCYFTDVPSDIIAYSLLNTTNPGGSELNLSKSYNDEGDVLISTWLKDNSTDVKTYATGIYTMSIQAKRGADTPATQRDVRIYFELWEFEGNGTDYAMISRSSKSDLITATRRNVIISASLNTTYTTTLGNYCGIKVYAEFSGGNKETIVYMYFAGETNSHLSTPTNKEILDTLYNPLLGYTPTQKLTATVTIAVTDWSGGLTCTKLVTGLLTTDTVLKAMDRANALLYGAAIITGDSESVAGQITFTAETTPTSEIVIPIEILR